MLDPKGLEAARAVRDKGYPHDTLAEQISAYLEAVGGKPAAWQRRQQYSGIAGCVPQWQFVSKEEATGHFERRPGYEYRPLYTAPQAPAVRVKGLPEYERLCSAASQLSLAETISVNKTDLRVVLGFINETAPATTTDERAVEALAVPEELCTLTFAVQHNPNCLDPWLVRLPGKGGSIDMKPYGGLLGCVSHQTGDILGFGKTLDEAARAALAQGESR